MQEQTLFDVVEETPKETVETKVVEPTPEPIRINKITIQNYKKIAHKVVVPNGKNLLFEGENGAGKTSIIEAVLWCLTGVLFDGTAKSDKQEVKPKGSSKETVTSVKVEFDYLNFSFERKMKEKYSKQGEYKGTDTTLLVNGGAVKSIKIAMSRLHDYLGISDTVSNFSKDPLLSNIDILQFFYNHDVIRDMDYKPLRALIIDMVGEPDHNETIQNNLNKYKVLIPGLKSHGNDLAAFKSSTKNAILDKQNGLKYKVSVAEGIIREYEEKANATYDKDEVDKARKELEQVENKLSDERDKLRSTSNNASLKYDNEIQKLQMSVYERKDLLTKEHQEKVNALKSNSQVEDSLREKQKSLIEMKNHLADIETQISEKNIEKSRVERDVEYKKQQLENVEREIERLKEQYLSYKNPKEKGREITCPHCNQVFHESETKEYQAHVEEKLAEINRLGEETNEKRHGIKEGIETKNYEIEEISNEILKLYDVKEQLDSNIKSLTKDIDELKEKQQQETAKLPILDIESDSVIIDLKKQIDTLKTERKTALTNVEEHKQLITNKINDLETKKNELLEIISQETNAQRYQKDAESKRKELDQLNKQLSEKEEISILIKELEKDMYQSLDEKLSNKFGENIKFKLYKYNVSNGEYDTRLCELYVKDSHGIFVNVKRLNTGLYPIRITEFITKIKQHYGIPKSFVLVDELASLDSKHKKQLTGLGEQVLATSVSDNKEIIEKEI